MTIHLKWIFTICCHCFSLAYVLAQTQDSIPSINTVVDSLPNVIVQPIDTISNNTSAHDKAGKMGGGKGKTNNANTTSNNNPTVVKDKVVLLDTIGKNKTTESIVKKKKEHSPKTAALLALLPGAGQIYNGKYWKLPIVYGGIGGLGYWGISSYSEYRKYKRAYNEQGDDNPNTTYTHPSNPNASLRELQLQKNFYRSQYEYGLIFGVLFYGLTIADAYVDAHLRTFDVSDNLSLKLSPKVEVLPSWAMLKTQTNLSLSLKFTPRTKKEIKTAIAYW